MAMVASREAFEWVGYAPLSECVQAQVDSAALVLAQAHLARDRAERLRAEAEELRGRSKARKS